MRKNVFAVLLLFVISTGLSAWESQPLLVYADMKSDYYRFMIPEIKEALAVPLMRREVRMKQKDLSLLKTDQWKAKDKVILLLNARDMNDETREIIAREKDNPQVFVWIGGGESLKDKGGADALTSATDNWDENALLVVEKLKPFVLNKDLKASKKGQIGKK